MTTFNPIAILAALGGRYQWRWWAAGLAYLLTGLGSVPVLHARDLQYTYFPTMVLTIAVFLSLVIIWAWGTRFAVSLGHRRGHVFLVTLGASFALTWGAYLLASIVRRLEFLIAADGMRVFVTAIPGDKFYTEAFFDLFFIMLAPIVTPIAIGVAAVVAATMRWGILGAVATAAGAAALLAIPSILPWSFYQAIPSEWSMQWLYAVIGVVLLAVAWAAFRRQPV